MFSALLISAREWLWPAAGFLVVAAVLLAWGYRRAPVERRLRGACFGLKLAGFLALAACLLEPLWSGQRARPGANYFVILADNSKGLQLRDAGETQTRGELLRPHLNETKARWIPEMDANFKVRRYLFDSRLQASTDFSELDFEGRSSSLGAALQSIAERYQNRPLAGVLLFTDGNATDLPDGLPNLAGLPPVYPVTIGRDRPPRDLALGRLSVNQTAFEDAPVTIQAEMLSSGYAGEQVAMELLELDSKTRRLEKPVQQQSLKASREGRGEMTQFQVRPEKQGVSFYRVRVASRANPPQPGSEQDSEEATLANNSRVLVVDRGRGPYRILYVSGRPNWEYKFLNRALAEDDQMEMVGLIRLAKREPKFEFKGRSGETSNPLFRGFDRKTEETERYDQPVLARLNTRDAAELRGGFPKTADELFAYHAIVLDDLESEFFTHDQMMLLQRFVSERGGGFLMLGGPDSFQHGKYDRTPVGDILPVYLNRIPEEKPLEQLKLHLTREGWLQPWARLRDTENEERLRLEQMPAFQSVNRARDIKPGAGVIATVTDLSGNHHPALVTQRFGRGRSAAMLLGDWWRWSLQRESHEQDDAAKAWRQLVRWLVSDVPNRIEIVAEPKPSDPAQSVVLRVRARDKDFKPLDNATVSVVIRKAEGQTGEGEVRLTAEPSASEPGLYEAVYVPRDSTGYLAETVVVDQDGLEAGKARTGWAVDFEADEFRSLEPNRSLLENLARQTGGEILDFDSLAAFARKLPHQQMPVTEAWTFPLWHTPVVFLFALACFIAEWGLRRWKGLP